MTTITIPNTLPPAEPHKQRLALQRLLDMHGADTVRWPAGSAAAFAALLANDAGARRMMDEARALDAVLDLAPAVAVPRERALADRIMAAALAAPGARSAYSTEGAAAATVIAMPVRQVERPAERPANVERSPQLVRERLSGRVTPKSLTVAHDAAAQEMAAADVAADSSMADNVAYLPAARRTPLNWRAASLLAASLLVGVGLSATDLAEPALRAVADAVGFAQDQRSVVAASDDNGSLHALEVEDVL